MTTSFPSAGSMIIPQKNNIFCTFGVWLGNCGMALSKNEAFIPVLKPIEIST